MNEIIRKILFATILILILLIVLVLGIKEINKANLMDEYLEKPEKNYMYEVAVEPREEIKYLNNAYIKQDFSNDKGEFSFATNESMYIGEINMWLPNNVTNSSIKCYNESRNDFNNKENLIKLKCNIIENENGHVIIEFDKKVFNDEKIVVTYSLHIIPNNFFDIFTNQVWYYGKEGNFIIKLGKNYECVEDCLYNLYHTDKATWLSTAKSIHLTFENYEEKLQQYRFEIITKSREILDNKNFHFSVGVSLLTGSILSIFSVIIYLFQSIDNGSIEKRIIDKLRYSIYSIRKKRKI